MLLHGSCLRPLQTLLPVLAFVGAAPSLRADVLRVGPGQLYAEIQPAVDAANPGDLVLVTPGTYAPFVIDDLSVSVIGHDGFFIVAQSASSPAITIRNVGRTSQSAGHSTARDIVSIVRARVRYATPSHPAVLATDCPGAVRLSQLDILRSGNLPNAATRAAVQANLVATFWLLDSRIGSATPWTGNTVNPILGNDGISALELIDTNAVVQNSSLMGYDNDNAYAGDALRAIGDTYVWIRDDHVKSPVTFWCLSHSCASLFRAGDGETGGHSVHQILTPAAPNRIQSCGQFPDYDIGTGLSVMGSIFGLNNRPGVGPGAGGSLLFPKQCRAELDCENSVVSNTVAPGGTVRIRFRSSALRKYFVLMNDTTLHTVTVPGYSGRLLFDPNVGYQVLGFGVSSAGQVIQIDVPLPASSSLAGFQATIQSVMGPVDAFVDTLSGPALVHVVE